MTKPTIHPAGLAAGAIILLTAGLATPAHAQFTGFTARTDYPLPASARPTDSVLADLDNDGDPDIALPVFTPSTFDSIAILLNNGDGTFAAATTTSVGSSPISIAAADMNLDGNIDLLTANRDSDDFSVRLGNGDGTFQPEIFRSAGAGPQGITVADFDRDGTPDVAVCNESDNTVSVFFGNGDGTTSAPTVWTTNNGGNTGGSRPRDIVAADLNFDGTPDIVTANVGSGTGTILYNAASSPGVFFSGEFAIFVDSPGAIDLAIDDLGPDGDPDLIFANNTGTVVTRFNETSEGPAPFPSFPSANTITLGGRPIGVAIADFDDLELDGDSDLVIADELGDRIVVLINTGNAVYTNAGSFDTASSPNEPAVADLDGDGDHDVIVPHFGANSVGVFLNANTIVGGPPPTVDLIMPDEGECLCPGTIDVTALIDAAPGTIAADYTLQYRRIGTTGYTTIAAGSGELNNQTAGVWDTTALPEGTYILRLTAENSGGVSASDEATVTLNQSFGGVSARLAAGLTSAGLVREASIVGRNACVFGSIGDPGCGSITYTVSQRRVGGSGTVPVEPGTPLYFGGRTNQTLATFDTTTVPDGDYEIFVSASNQCDQTDSDMITFTVDNTPPIARIETPENCDFFSPSAALEIKGTASDTNISGWSLQYTGGPANNWVTIASGNTSITGDTLATWDTSDLPPCAYTLRLTVSDKSVTNCGSGGQSAQYLTSISLGCRADLAAPFGILDLSDIGAFVDSFNAGCP